ncbi:BTB and MATH domain-containing protein 38-like [Dreissena polymorpha]|uniref:BTB domain-containing protein n=1 Tax=Dreissena polymorpha TaxID=45954 RepID=A0A9D4L3R2_DREPO|nr:BTB and MATH domain-containing protein 38-like [Dreissena polymorpha]KAH3851198.1 hypothetical protein DPMN_093678 [Dreissena polymorpha]
METRVYKPNEQTKSGAIDVSIFSEDSDLTDLTLIVEEIRIPVIKAVLSLSSPVFKKMFEGEWKEKNQSEVYLPEKKLVTFVPFLCCLYPNLKERITTENAAFILPLASEYQVVKLMEQCEDTLLTFMEGTATNDMSCEEVCKYLKLAEQHERTRLSEYCVLRLSRFPLYKRKKCLTENNISLENQCKIAEAQCKRHELDEKDVKSLIYLFPEKTIFQQIRDIGSTGNPCYENSIEHSFTSVRVSYYMYGKDSKIYRDMLKRLKKNVCNKDKKFLPTYSDFEYLPEDLKNDLQRVIPGFRK